MRVYTVGHLTRSSEELIALLEEHRVSSLVDVRRFSTSKRHPYFSREVLEATLRVGKIAYTHEPDLGGYRKARLDSPNTAWRVAGFRGYADHPSRAAARAEGASLAETVAASEGESSRDVAGPYHRRPRPRPILPVAAPGPFPANR